MKPSIDIVDVFSSVPGKGNPVAVVYGCYDHPLDWQQSFAQWIGLPETVFVDGHQAPAQSVAVRIFSPRMELAFAGHPAIGTVRSLIDRQQVSNAAEEVLLLCKAGEVRMHVDTSMPMTRIAFTTLKPSSVDCIDEVKEEIGSALGGIGRPISVSVVDTGARWIVVTYAKADSLSSLRPDYAKIEAISDRFSVSGISVVAKTEVVAEAQFEVRSFAPAIGVAEDAVCGGGNACVAAAIAASHGFASGSACYTAAQGFHLNRDGRIYSSGPFDDRRFRIAGEANVVLSSDLKIPANFLQT